MTWRRTTFLLLILLAFIFEPRQATAQEPSVGFDSDQPIALITNGTSTPVAVFNDTAKVIQAEVRFQPATGTTVEAVMIKRRGDSDSPAAIAANSVAAYELTTTVASGKGWLVIVHGTLGIVDRRAVTIGPAALNVPVATWDMQVERWWPGKLHGNGDDLAATGSCPKDTILVTVAASQVVDSVEISCTALDDGTTLALKHDSADLPIGDYTGELLAGSKKVAVKVRVTTHWWVPALLVVLGFAVALFFGGWTTVWRRANGLVVKTLAMQANVVHAHEQYLESAGTQSWKVYDPRKSILDALDTVAAEISAVSSGKGLGRLVAPDNVGEKLDGFETLVDEWATVLKAWPDVADELAKVSALGPAGGDDQPAFANELAKMVGGTFGTAPGDLSVDEFKKLIPAGAYGETAVALWRRIETLNRTLDQISTQIADDEAGSSLYTQARSKCIELIVQFTTEDSLALLANAATQTTVERLEVEVDKLPYHLPETAPLGGQTLDSMGTRKTDREATVRFRAAAASLRRNGVMSRILLADWVYFALALIVGMWAGLQALYVDKPWGTLIDLAAMFLWGFAATAVLTTMGAALRSVVHNKFEA